MRPLTRSRLLLLTVFLFPVVVIVLFWIFGKEPQNPADTLPLIPPH
jgi:hypothetical protein